MLRELATSCLAASLLVSCLPTGEKEKTAKSVPKVEERTRVPAGEASAKSPDQGAPAKVPFDESRLPVAIEIDEGVRADQTPRVALAAPAPELSELESTTPYDLALARAREALEYAPLRVGLDVLAIPPPQGKRATGLDVDPEGRATLWFGTDEGNSHLVRVEAAPSAKDAIDRLRANLASCQVPLEEVELGDLSFARFEDGNPTRILFVRGHVLVEVRSLDGSGVDSFAMSIDELAMAAPFATQDSPPAKAELRLAGEPRSGTSIELELDFRPDEPIVGRHLSATADAWAAPSGGRLWLLSPTPGKKVVRAVLFDRWLRKIETSLEVLVTGEG